MAGMVELSAYDMLKPKVEKAVESVLDAYKFSQYIALVLPL
jgi:hypothetical protein